MNRAIVSHHAWTPLHPWCQALVRKGGRAEGEVLGGR